MTRRVIAGALTLLAFAFLTSPAGATHKPGLGPHKDLLVGSGSVVLPTPFGNFNVRIDVDAESKPNGKAGGTFAAHISGIINVNVSGHVTCLRVSGPEVVLGGEIEQSDFPQLAPPGSGVIAMGLDNGVPNGSPVDSALALPVAQVYTTCPAAVFAGSPLVEGDFSSHDGFSLGPGL